MTRVILHLAKAVVALLTSMLFFSCGLDMKRVDGSGTVITQQRDAGAEFTSITVTGDVDVVIEQGPQRAITVEADDNIQEHIKTEVKGGELIIDTDANFSSDSKKNITIVLPTVKAIESGASARVKNKGTLKADGLTLHSSSGSHMELSIDAAEATYEASSGSSMKVSGKAGKAEAKASSGALADAGATVSPKVKAEASSGGTVIINAVDDLDASASSGGNVLYVKTPANLSKDTSSGGNVSQQ
ncbi:MAG: head GIN domain-containing protein [Flavobacterium sp.]